MNHRSTLPAWLLLTFLVLLGSTTATTATSESSSSDNNNEQTPVRDLVVGGQDAPKGKYPFFSAAAGNPFCGASLIHSDILLTAAHCEDAFQRKDDVYIGAYAYRSSSGGAIKRRIAQTLEHPDFDMSEYAYDYLLLKLEEPVPEEDFEPIELNSDPNFPSNGQKVTFMGLGLTSGGGDPADTLMELDLSAMSQSSCAGFFALGPLLGLQAIDIVRKIHLCAEPGMLQQKGSCNGDSGGPAIVNGKQVGVVSFGGLNCANFGAPSVFARVSGAYDWIQAGICDMSDSPPCSCPGSPCETEEPTPTPTPEPTHEPTPEPTPEPTHEPTPEPTPTPSSVPTEHPTLSNVPTDAPSVSMAPSTVPTLSVAPSMTPSRSVEPTISPTTTAPTTLTPTTQPSVQPTTKPSTHPTSMPTSQPTVAPTTSNPTAPPSVQPTTQPSTLPTSPPTSQPTSNPTTPIPTAPPSTQPTAQPSTLPTSIPTSQPTLDPTAQPTTQPVVPTDPPTQSIAPSTNGGAVPSVRPSLLRSGSSTTNNPPESTPPPGVVSPTTPITTVSPSSTRTGATIGGGTIAAGETEPTFRFASRAVEKQQHSLLLVGLGSLTFVLFFYL